MSSNQIRNTLIFFFYSSFTFALAITSTKNFAAAPVVEAKDLTSNQSAQQNRLIADLVLQVQRLQNEVRQLRGLVEEQEYRMTQLTNQQRDLYLDIDRRLQNVGQVTATTGSEPTQSSASNVTSANSAANTSPKVSVQAQSSEVQAAYNKAFDLLKAKEHAAAKKSFQAFLKDNSTNPLASNAHYWLGQLHFNDKQYGPAEAQFKAVFEKFPNAAKTDVAMYKIGLIHQSKGDKAAAKVSFQKVVKQFPNTTAGKLAKAKLDTL